MIAEKRLVFVGKEHEIKITPIATSTSWSTKSRFLHIKPIGSYANKTVLLRERKRHTDRRLASTPCAVLSRGGDKKVLLRDCKRHTACGVSCPWHVMSGGGGVPVLVLSRGGGTSVLVLTGVHPPPKKHLGPKTGVPPPLWTDRQTPVKTLPSRRTTYAGGNNRNASSIV